MKTWQKFAAVNVGALVGIFITIFALPPTTPVKYWTIGAIIALALLNYGLVRRVKAPKSTPANQRFVLAVGILGFLLFLLDLALRAGWPR